jgi:hypothetical protein
VVLRSRFLSTYPGSTSLLRYLILANFICIYLPNYQLAALFQLQEFRNTTTNFYRKKAYADTEHLLQSNWGNKKQLKKSNALFQRQWLVIAFLGKPHEPQKIVRTYQRHFLGSSFFVCVFCRCRLLLLRVTGLDLGCEVVSSTLHITYTASRY